MLLEADLAEPEALLTPVAADAHSCLTGRPSRTFRAWVGDGVDAFC